MLERFVKERIETESFENNILNQERIHIIKNTVENAF